MKHLSAKVHAVAYGLFRPKPRRVAFDLYSETTERLRALDLATAERRAHLAHLIAQNVTNAFQDDVQLPPLRTLAKVTQRILDFEGLFQVPDFDWDRTHSIAAYWALTEELKRLLVHLKDIETSTRLIALTVAQALDAFVGQAPRKPATAQAAGGLNLSTELIHAVPDAGKAIEHVLQSVFHDELQGRGLFDRHWEVLENRMIVASGGVPGDTRLQNRMLKLPSQLAVASRHDLFAAYLGGTPIGDLFRGSVSLSVPAVTRFEHHHIVAGSGHGKTQTLQALIAGDLKAVAQGERTVIVIDSQGDLIRRISHLNVFAKGQALHERIVLIDPTDVEWPVSLNLFDVGLERLNAYSKLERERLRNSILELYDFVLGSLLSAEMTQKQNVIFRYVTRLMLTIPDATIHTLRKLMEPKSELKFAPHIETLTGTAREFFRTEFASSEFTQTRKQVLRRLWGILENQTFERMFSHPRSKLDLFAEMNAGKVILINTAKDLLKESGTEIFGRFFIALIAQAAQERATLKESDRVPTIVYIDEAAEYFDRNIETILSQARKYKVGMVLAHQYLGQLESKLQDAFAANTAIKFAGGVSNKDARTLAQMMSCAPDLLESQPKGGFAASVRGLTKSALPVSFQLGLMEDMPQMPAKEFHRLRARMRAAYAVHHAEMDAQSQQDRGDQATDDRGKGKPGAKAGGQHKPSPSAPAPGIAPRASRSPGNTPNPSRQADDPDDRAKSEW